MCCQQRARIKLSKRSTCAAKKSDGALRFSERVEGQGWLSGREHGRVLGLPPTTPRRAVSDMRASRNRNAQRRSFNIYRPYADCSSFLHPSLSLPQIPSSLHNCFSVIFTASNMSSLPPVYIVSAARTPVGMFLGCASFPTFNKKLINTNSWSPLQVSLQLDRRTARSTCYKTYGIVFTVQLRKILTRETRRCRACGGEA
jgi:hypothetical protein